jgi:hypothetical protein
MTKPASGNGHETVEPGKKITENAFCHWAGFDRHRWYGGVVRLGA